MMAAVVPWQISLVPQSTIKDCGDVGLMRLHSVKLRMMGLIAVFPRGPTVFTFQYKVVPEVPIVKLCLGILRLLAV